MDKLKIKFSLKKIALFLVVIYSILVVFWVARDDGFYGIRILSIWSIVMMCIIISYFIYLDFKFKLEPAEKENYDKNIKIKLLLGALLVMPMVMGLPDKLAILFYNIDNGYEKAEVYNVEISRYLKTGTGRQGGDIWATAKNLTGRQEKYVLICNLISLVECDLGHLKGENAVVKLSMDNGYPLKDRSLVYSFKSKSLNIDEKEWINLYKENKRYIFKFLILIYIPSILFAFFVPRLFKSDAVLRES
jgi:hypothetical protein